MGLTSLIAVFLDWKKEACIMFGKILLAIGDKLTKCTGIKIGSLDR